jgi:hypothetical protein
LGGIEIVNLGDFNEDEARDKLLKLMVLAKNCNQQDLGALEMHLEQIREHSEDSIDEGVHTGILFDVEDDVAQIINDSNFREDRVGLNATKCEELLRLVHKYLGKDDPNIEVVLACNPFIPADVLNDLIISESFWEEDGTQQALARNRKEVWILEQLAQSDQEMTRYEVALNDATPSSVLEQLIQDTGQCDWRVEEIKFGEVSPYRGFIRWAVIQNQNTPRSTLEEVVAGNLPTIDSDVDSILKNIAKAFLDK